MLFFLFFDFGKDWLFLGIGCYWLLLVKGRELMTGAAALVWPEIDDVLLALILLCCQAVPLLNVFLVFFINQTQQVVNFIFLKLRSVDIILDSFVQHRSGHFFHLHQERSLEGLALLQILLNG